MILPVQDYFIYFDEKMWQPGTFGIPEVQDCQTALKERYIE